ncbi:MAG: PQQ-binding-like beta-propeller repeat protein [Bdellovibrionaceae bacterium]|nr:PQQ-binding-like beta-propeller repeat protein [Pseudobdellovibrionaceae bacterium]
MRTFILSSTVAFLSSCATPLKEEARVFELRRAWSRAAVRSPISGNRKLNRMTPIRVGELVIAGNGHDGVSAWKANTGRLKWHLPVRNGVEGGAAVIRDIIFFGGNDGLFYSVTAVDGRILWTFDAKAEHLSEPTLDTSRGVVFFLSSQNVVYALSAESGKQLWLYSHQDTSNFSVRGGSKPVLHNDVLYVGFSDGSFTALSAQSGGVKWEVKLNRNRRFRDIDARAYVDGDRLFVSGFDDKLYCLNRDSGAVIWTVDRGGHSGVTAHEDLLFYPTTDGQVLALDRKSGNVRWSYSLSSGIATSVGIYKGFVVFGESSGALRFLRLEDGKPVYSFFPGRGILSEPRLVPEENRIYFLSGEANLYALDAGYVRRRWFDYLGW